MSADIVQELNDEARACINLADGAQSAIVNERENRLAMQFSRAAVEIVRLRGEVPSWIATWMADRNILPDDDGDGINEWALIEALNNHERELLAATAKVTIAPAEAKGEWPAYVMLRDTKLHDDAGGLGQRIFTTAGAGYEKVKYVRADLAATQPAGGCAVAPEDVGRFVELAAQIISGAPFPSGRSLHKARQISDIALSLYTTPPVAQVQPVCPPQDSDDPVEWLDFVTGNSVEVVADALAQPVAQVQQEAVYWERWHPVHGVVSVNREPLGKSLGDDRWEDRPLYRATHPAAGDKVRELANDDRVPDDYRNQASGYRAGWNDAVAALAQPQSGGDA